ncbi:Cas10/Cmr2 second palm domain-containing protein [Microbispora triticiradicis]|uniref:Cas10/Cmr2 second palm domain-containing protein n=1 Tax=Microbispora triticiradicis TaxID=2200763 RepID=UPI001AD76441|nr:hypothetical protein [Microbispora triticiradicis]MBO4270950.1 hypothetical protein [Microbispora triticiradicis]
MHLVVVNAAGKQRYIFSSRKRQEIVGASDLIARVNGEWAAEALRDVFHGYRDDWRLRHGHEAELLTAGAGAVTLRVADPAAGRRLVTALTTRALEEAPGLDVCGVVHELRPGGEAGTLAAGLRAARTALAATQEARPGPQARFLRLPLMEECGSSGQPATELRREGPGERPSPRSAASMAKLAHFPAALDRLARDAGSNVPTMRKIVDRLGLEAEWVSIVHADGNGFGRIFQDLGTSTGSGKPGCGDRKSGEPESAGPGDEAYADLLRGLSRAVDRCALTAFRTALRRTADEHPDRTIAGVPPVLPLVLGGDDLTVICEGEVALGFTRHYLEAFERATADDLDLFPVLRAKGLPNLGAAAGVAIVKRNYPFRFAYDLAEELITKEAKQDRDVGSALAFAVLLESSAPDLDRIRRSVTVAGSGGVAPHRSPYVVGAGCEDPRTEGRRWADLERRVTALTGTHTASGEALVPRAAVHDLREAVSLGAEVARARLGLLRTRYREDEHRLDALTGLCGDLVGQDAAVFLDALAAQPFLSTARSAATSRDDAEHATALEARSR